MAQKRGDKFEDAYLDFDDEATYSLDQIFDSISVSPSIPSEIIEENPKEDFFQHKIDSTINDITMLESNAVQVALADIDNLYKGTYLHDQATRYHITEEEAKERQRNNLASQLKAWGLKCINKKHYPLPREIKHIIRMDFYGTVREPLLEKLSKTFLERDMEDSIYSEPKDYDLSSSSTWNVFRQFRSFKLLERDMPRLLIDEGITPEKFQYLNSYDFSQILYNHYIRKSKANADDEKNANLFLGAKYRFVKALVRNKEAHLYNYMQMNKVDYRYTNALIKNMKRYGITSNFDVINDVYTKEMLEFLRKHKLVLEKTQPGDQITDKQAEIIKKAGYISTIIARDEEGNPISGPHLTTHHGTAVQDAGEKTIFSDVNLFHNLCLMVEPYHFIAHSLDKTAEVNNAEFYVSRIEIDPEIAFYGGFNKLFQIKHNFEIPHLQNYNSEILNDFKNKKTSYWEQSEQTQKNSRKQKKKQKNIQRIIKEIITEVPTEDNSRRKKEKHPKPFGFRTYKTKEDILREEERRAENLRQKRKEYLSVRAAKKAALKNISESIPDQKIEYMIISNLPSKTNEKTSAQNTQNFKTIEEINRERINSKKELRRKRAEEQQQKRTQKTLPNIPQIVFENIRGTNTTINNIINSITPPSIALEHEQDKTSSLILKMVNNQKTSENLQETKPQTTPTPQPKKVEKEVTPAQAFAPINTNKNRDGFLLEKKKKIDEYKQKYSEKQAMIAAKKTEKNSGQISNPILFQQNIQKDMR